MMTVRKPTPMNPMTMQNRKTHVFFQVKLRPAPKSNRPGESLPILYHPFQMRIRPASILTIRPGQSSMWIPSQWSLVTRRNTQPRKHNPKVISKWKRYSNTGIVTVTNFSRNGRTSVLRTQHGNQRSTSFSTLDGSIPFFTTIV